MSAELKNAREIVSVLTEALPYIQQFNNQIIVIKYGGNAMLDDKLKNGFTRDIVLMQSVGMLPVIVHGGGPQIAEALSKIGKTSKFIHGIRITDGEAMMVVAKVLEEKINQEIVTLIKKNGGTAQGMTTKSHATIRAKQMVFENTEKTVNASDPIDLGHVGVVQEVNAPVIHEVIKQNFIPVISPVGVGEGQKLYNINADFVAGKVAEALLAEKLIILTNADGLLDSKGNTLTGLTTAAVDKLIHEDVIYGGMLPKIKAVLTAVNTVVHTAHIIDGRIPNAVLLEIFTKQGIGTLIAKNTIDV